MRLCRTVAGSSAQFGSSCFKNAYAILWLWTSRLKNRYQQRRKPQEQLFMLLQFQNLAQLPLMLGEIVYKTLRLRTYTYFLIHFRHSYLHSKPALQKLIALSHFTFNQELIHLNFSKCLLSHPLSPLWPPSQSHLHHLLLPVIFAVLLLQEQPLKHH